MSLGVILLLLVVPMLVSVAAIVIARLYQRRGPIVRFPEVAAERPNDLNFGFAIILGFVLVAALGTFQDARQAATDEARAVTTLSRTALTMPAPLRDDLSHQLVCYARQVIQYDWGNREPDGGAAGSRFVDATSDRISQTVATAANGNAVRDAALGALIEGEAELREARSLRHDRAAQLPALFWVMVVIGAILVITLSAVLLASDFNTAGGVWFTNHMAAGAHHMRFGVDHRLHARAHRRPRPPVLERRAPAHGGTDRHAGGPRFGGEIRIRPVGGSPLPLTAWQGPTRGRRNAGHGHHLTHHDRRRGRPRAGRVGAHRLALPALGAPAR